MGNDPTVLGAVDIVKLELEELVSKGEIAKSYLDEVLYAERDYKKGFKDIPEMIELINDIALFCRGTREDVDDDL